MQAFFAHIPYSCTVYKVVGVCLSGVSLNGRFHTRTHTPSGNEPDAHCTSQSGTSFLYTLQTMCRTTAWQPSGQDPTVVFVL